MILQRIDVSNFVISKVICSHMMMIRCVLKIVPVLYLQIIRQEPVWKNALKCQNYLEKLPVDSALKTVSESSQIYNQTNASQIVLMDILRMTLHGDV